MSLTPIPGLTSRGVVGKWLASQAAVGSLLTVDANGDVLTATSEQVQTAADLPSALLPYQLISTLSESIDDRVAALLVAGTGISLTYNDAAGTLTIATTGGGGGGTWGSITGTLANQVDLNNALNARQPLDSDLTAIAALTTTAFGRSLLTQADAAATRTTIGLGVAATPQFAGVTSTGTTNNGSQVLRVQGSGGGFARINDNGTMIVDGDVSTGTNPLSVRYNGVDQWFFNFSGSLNGRTGCVLNIGAGQMHLTHSGSTSQINTFGNLALRPGNLGGGGTSVDVTGNLTTSGLVTCGGGFNLASRTKTAVLASSPAINAGRFQLSDSGLVGREVYPDGTNWRYASDDSIVT